MLCGRLREAAQPATPAAPGPGVEHDAGAVYAIWRSPAGAAPEAQQLNVFLGRGSGRCLHAVVGLHDAATSVEDLYGIPLHHASGEPAAQESKQASSKAEVLWQLVAHAAASSHGVTAVRSGGRSDPVAVAVQYFNPASSSVEPLRCVVLPL